MKKIYLIARGNSKSMTDLSKSYKTKEGKKLLKTWKRERLKQLRKIHKKTLKQIKKIFKLKSEKKYARETAYKFYYKQKRRIKNSILPDYKGYGMEVSETYIDEFINKN